jgi:hypothetical protein
LPFDEKLSTGKTKLQHNWSPAGEAEAGTAGEQPAEE